MTKTLKKFTRVLATVLVVTFLLSNMSFAVTDTKHQELLQTQVNNEKDFYKTIKAVEKSVQRNTDGTFEIKGTPNVQAEYLTIIKTNMLEINKLIQAGILETDSNLRVYADEKYILKGNLKTNKANYVDYDVFFKDTQKSSLNVSLGRQTVSLSLNGNVSYADSYQPPVGAYYYWWGYMVSMDERTTQLVINQIYMGAGAAGIAGVFCSEGIITWPGALPAFVFSGILTIGAAYMSWIDAYGGNHGVYIDVYAYAAPWIWYRS